MALRLADHWIWDFWIVDHDGTYHVFYLKAPRSLGDPELRHWNVTIGHAVSTDLSNWDPVEDALGPGSGDDWDSKGTWTGSVVRFGGEWRMYYTGVSSVEDGRVQRIGLATSPDLFVWTKHPANPLIETDPRWYETIDSGVWIDQGWRDPWVHAADDGMLYAYITARVKHGPPAGRGVIALAQSQDGIDWTVHPPISEPGQYGSLEVPQLVSMGDRWYLVFSVSASEISAERRQRHAPLSGVHYLESSSPLGPFEWAPGPFLAADEHGTRYAGKVLTHRGRPVLITSRHKAANGDYVGVLGDPEPLTVTGDGRLRVVDGQSSNAGGSAGP